MKQVTDSDSGNEMKKYILLLIFLLSSFTISANEKTSATPEDTDRIFHTRINIGFAVDFTGTPGRLTDQDWITTWNEEWNNMLTNLFGASAGIDFDWKLFQKTGGEGAGELYFGFGASFQYWPPTAEWRYYNGDKAKLQYMRIPVMLNISYNFKVDAGNLNSVGPEFSAGINNNLFLLDYEAEIFKEWDDNLKFHQLSFTWTLGINLIFVNNCFISVSVGGDKGSEQLKNYLFSEDAGKFLYGHHEFLMFETGYRF